MKYFFILILLTFQVKAFADNIDSLQVKTYQEKAAYYCDWNLDSAYYFLDKIITLARDANDQTLFLNTVIEKADCASYNLQVEKVARYLQVADSMITLQRRAGESVPASVMIKIKNQWADYWYEIGHFDLSLENSFWIENELLGKEKLENIDLQYLKHNALFIAASYFKKNDYEKSLRYYYQSSYYEKLMAARNRTPPEYGYLNYFLAPVYQAKGDLDSALYYYHSFLNFLDQRHEGSSAKNGRTSAYLMTCLNLSSLYRKKHDIDSAEWILKKSLVSHAPGDSFYGKTYYEFGLTYLAKKEYQQAIRYFNQSIDVQNKNANYANNYQVAKAYTGIGDVYFLQQKYGEAISNYDLAINILTREDMTDDSRFDFNYANILSKPDLLEALRKKAQAIYQTYLMQPEEKNYLVSAFNVAGTAVELLKKMVLDLSSDEDKQYLINDSYALYALLIEIAHLQGDQFYESAFNLLEGSKAINLFLAVQSNNLTDLLLHEDVDAAEQILQLKHALGQSNADLLAENDFGSRQKKYADHLELKRKFDDLMARIEKQNSEYVRFKNNLSQTIPVKVLSGWLRPDQTLVQYFIHDTTAFLFVISPGNEQVQIKKIAWGRQWANMAESMKKDLFYRADKAYLKKASTLFDHLVKPALELSDTDRLVIVPDGELWNVPFGALLTTGIPSAGPDYKTLPYLGMDKSISYAFSATLLHEMSLRKRKNKGNGLMAFAPAYREPTAIPASLIAYKSTLYPLVYSEDECHSIQHLMGGYVWGGVSATKANFLEAAGRADMLHISAHALANVEDPGFSYIAFSNAVEPFELFVHELYHHPIPAGMVVLSACETAVGPVWKGEGAISIARAFAYGGAQSIVTTLWRIEEESARDISVAYYRFLKKGMTKDAALQLAQKAYLQKNNLDQDRAHPHYWAAFTVLGSLEPLCRPMWQKWLIGFFVAGAALGLVFIILKKIKNN